VSQQKGVLKYVGIIPMELSVMTAGMCWTLELPVGSWDIQDKVLN